MDAERLTPPSPTAREITWVLYLARRAGYAHQLPEAHAIADCCAWILGQGERPKIPGTPRVPPHLPTVPN